MARLTDLELAKAFVAPAAPSFADVVARLEKDEQLSPSRRRDMISGLRRVAGVIGWRLDDIPADPVWLRPRIAKVAPAAHGLTRKTWTNTVSNARSALAAAGVVERERGSPLPLTPAWRTLWDRALASGDRNITVPLSRFVRFASSIGAAPAEVTDGTLADFRRALELCEIRKDPDAAAWQTAHAWNRACARIEGWPGQVLTGRPGTGISPMRSATSLPRSRRTSPRSRPGSPARASRTRTSASALSLLRRSTSGGARSCASPRRWSTTGSPCRRSPRSSSCSTSAACGAGSTGWPGTATREPPRPACISSPSGSACSGASSGSCPPLPTMAFQ